MAPAIKAKVHSLPGVEHLYSAISKDQLEIPAYITEYDMTVRDLWVYIRDETARFTNAYQCVFQVNGLHYFQPTGPPTSS